MLKEVIPLYTEQELASIRAAQNKRWLYLAIPSVLLVVAIVYSLTVRLEWLTSGATVVLGFMLIFFYDMTIKPLHRYEIHVDNCLHGRKRELECTYHAKDMDLSVVDGVKYYGLIVLQPDEKGDPFERLLYWDAQKPFPDLQAGDKLHIVYHDKMIAEIHRI